jgi:hypothetical protein
MARFLGPVLLNNHFQLHGSDFGAATAGDYELLASQFLESPLLAPKLEHKRSLGDLVRFDPSNDHFGTMRGGVIRTFYIPVPCITLPPAQRAAARAAKKCHWLATNMLHYQATCASW